MKQETKAWILLGSIFLVFITSMPKKQEKHEPKVKKYTVIMKGYPRDITN